MAEDDPGYEIKQDDLGRFDKGTKLSSERAREIGRLSHKRDDSSRLSNALRKILINESEAPEFQEAMGQVIDAMSGEMKRPEMVKLVLALLDRMPAPVNITWKDTADNTNACPTCGRLGEKFVERMTEKLRPSVKLKHLLLWTRTFFPNWSINVVDETGEMVDLDHPTIKADGSRRPDEPG